MKKEVQYFGRPLTVFPVVHLDGLCNGSSQPSEAPFPDEMVLDTDDPHGKGEFYFTEQVTLNECRTKCFEATSWGCTFFSFYDSGGSGKGVCYLHQSCDDYDPDADREPHYRAYNISEWDNHVTYDDQFSCTNDEDALTYWWIGTKASQVSSGVTSSTGVRYDAGDVLMLPKEGMMLGEEFTIDFWSKLPEGASSENGYHTLLSDSSSEEVQPLVLRYSDRKLGFVTGGDYVNSMFSGNALMPNDGAWHRITVIVDNQKYSVFVDGMVSGSAIESFTRYLPRRDRLTTVRCLGNTCDGKHPWGYLSTVNVLRDRALSSVDIKSMHEGTLDELLPSVAVGCFNALRDNMKYPMWTFGSRGGFTPPTVRDSNNGVGMFVRKTKSRHYISCTAIKQANSNAVSGHYYIQPAKENVQRVWCDMDDTWPATHWRVRYDDEDTYYTSNKFLNDRSLLVDISGTSRIVGGRHLKLPETGSSLVDSVVSVGQHDGEDNAGTLDDDSSIRFTVDASATHIYLRFVPASRICGTAPSTLDLLGKDGVWNTLSFRSVKFNTLVAFDVGNKLNERIVRLRHVPRDLTRCDLKISVLSPASASLSSSISNPALTAGLSSLQFFSGSRTNNLISSVAAAISSKQSTGSLFNQVMKFGTGTTNTQTGHIQAIYIVGGDAISPTDRTKSRNGWVRVLTVDPNQGSSGCSSSTVGALKSDTTVPLSSPLQNSGWNLHTRNNTGEKVCRATSFSNTFSSSVFVQRPLGMEYTKVRGSVQAYSDSNQLDQQNIDARNMLPHDIYTNGMSISKYTNVDSTSLLRRDNIWTYVVGDERSCPCAGPHGDHTHRLPSFTTNKITCDRQLQTNEVLFSSRKGETTCRSNAERNGITGILTEGWTFVAADVTPMSSDGFELRIMSMHNDISYFDIKSAHLDVYVPHLSNHWTIEMWVKIEHHGHKMGTIYHDSGVNGDVRVDALSDGRVSCSVQSKDSNKKRNTEVLEILSQHRLPVHTWSHVACILNDKTFTMYMNGGQLDFSQATNAMLGPVDTVGETAPLIGCATTLCNETPFVGQLDDVRIWKTSRTKEEIKMTISPEEPSSSFPLSISTVVTSATSATTSQQQNDGTSYDRAAETCLSLKRLHPSSNSGAYWIGGSVPTLVHCDMSSHGGGWVAVWKQVGGSTARDYTNFTDPAVSNRDLFSDDKRSHTNYVDPTFEQPGVIDEQLYKTFSASRNVEWMKSSTLYHTNGNLVDAQHVLLRTGDASLSNIMNVDVGCTPVSTPLTLTVGTTGQLLSFGAIVKNASSSGKVGLPTKKEEDCGAHSIHGGEDVTSLLNGLKYVDSSDDVLKTMTKSYLQNKWLPAFFSSEDENKDAGSECGGYSCWKEHSSDSQYYEVVTWFARPLAPVLDTKMVLRYTMDHVDGDWVVDHSTIGNNNDGQLLKRTGAVPIVVPAEKSCTVQWTERATCVAVPSVSSPGASSAIGTGSTTIMSVPFQILEIKQSQCDGGCAQGCRASHIVVRDVHDGKTRNILLFNNSQTSRSVLDIDVPSACQPPALPSNEASAFVRNTQSNLIPRYAPVPVFSWHQDQPESDLVVRTFDLANEGLTIVIEGQSTYTVPVSDALPLVNSNANGIMVGVLPSMQLCVGVVDNNPASNSECQSISANAKLSKLGFFHLVISVPPVSSPLQHIQAWLNGDKIETTRTLAGAKIFAIGIFGEKKLPTRWCFLVFRATLVLILPSYLVVVVAMISMWHHLKEY